MSFADDYGLTDYDIMGDPVMLNKAIRKTGMYKRSVIDQEVWAERDKQQKRDEKYGIEGH